MQIIKKQKEAPTINNYMNVLETVETTPKGLLSQAKLGETVETVKDKNINKEMEEIAIILEKLNKDRFGYFDSWRDLLFIFVNENRDISIFNKYVEQCKNYNKKRNLEIIKTVKPNENGLKKNKTLF